MRDIAVLILFVFLVFFALRRPFIGVCAWIWVAMAFPAGWAWGFSSSLRINFTVAILTFVGYIFYKNKAKLRLDGISVLIAIFWLIALISTFTTQSLLKEFVWSKFFDVSKILLLYIAVILIIEKKLHIDTLIWAIVLSISAYAGMEAVKFILSGGGHRVAGHAGHVLGDRNDLVVAINMGLPLLIYLIGQTKHKLLKQGLIGLFILNLVAIIGSYSRGGFIGLTILTLYFFLKSNRKFIWSMLFVITVPIAVQFAPSEWTSRMNTIESASSDDRSFIGRLWAWKISTKIANDNFFGNGFYATQDPLAWETYKHQIDNFGPIKTPPVEDRIKPKAAHSIYFQTLGDLGYLGLIVVLLILSSFFFRLRKIAKLAREQGIEWAEKLATLMSVSIVAYGITGASVSLIYFDLLFVLFGISYVLLNRVVDSPNKVVKRPQFAK